MAIEREALREGLEIRKVTPPYTSFIGRFKYQPQYGIGVHHTAALVIRRRGDSKSRAPTGVPGKPAGRMFPRPGNTDARSPQVKAKSFAWKGR